MMTPQKEQQLAAQIRLIAREYCDGAFNKIEYRRRRREILLQCVEQDFNARPDEPEERLEAAPSRPTVKPSRTNWLPYMMVGVTVLVLGVMGFLLIAMM